MIKSYEAFKLNCDCNEFEISIFTTEQSFLTMATITQTQTDSVERLLAELPSTNTMPLWAQMHRLNPPLPNPKSVPYVWHYDQIRPYLLRAGNPVTEKQAERRVLMLVNPAMGEPRVLRCAVKYVAHEDCDRRGSAYHRHSQHWPTARHAERNSTRTSPHRICDAIHN